MKTFEKKILLTNIDCEFFLEPPQQKGSSKYSQFLFVSRYKRIALYTPVLQYKSEVNYLGALA